MAARTRVNIVLTGIMAGLVTSCQGPTGRPDLSLATRGAPPELQTISDQAQQIMAAVVDDNWPQVRTCVKNLDDAWQAYKYPTVASLVYPRPPAILQSGPLDGAMFRLRFANGQGWGKEILQAANEVDAAALPMFEYYVPALPLDLRRLRMLEGRIVLNAVQNKKGPASDAFREVCRVWGRVRPAVATGSSPNAVTTFEDCLSAQQTALNQPDREALLLSARQAIDALTEILRSSYEEKKEEPAKIK